MPSLATATVDAPPPGPDRPLLILGTRPYALEFADVVAGCPGWTVAGFVENLDRSKAGTTLERWPVHWIDDVGTLAADHWAVCSLATHRRDGFIAQAAGHGLRFATPVHATAHVSPRSRLGSGVRVGVGAIVAAYSAVGDHTSLNRGATVGHHTQIASFCTLQPRCNLAGNCRVGDRTLIGMSAVVIDGVQIGSRCVVGAGAVVTRDLPDGVLAVGVPARVIKEGIDGK